MCPALVFVQKIQFLHSLSSSVQTANFIMANFTPNMYFELKNMQNKLFGKELKINPSLATK